MPRPPAELHDRVRLRVEEMISVAMRADAADPATDFAGQARHLVLAVGCRR